MLSYILSGNVFNIVVNNQVHVVDNSHPNYANIKKFLLSKSDKPKDENELLSLIDIPQSIAKFSNGKVTIENNKVMYEGEEIKGQIANRIIELMNDGYDYLPYIKFLEKLMSNPSAWALESAYRFLDQKGLPITEDGDVIGYKSVRQDYFDWYSGTINNAVGAKIKRLPRNKVDDNRLQACSFGYHIGGIGYVRNFHGSEGRVMLVKFNPADIVSIPADSAQDKIRVTYYEVIGELGNREILEKPLYANDGGDALKNTDDDDYDDETDIADYEDEDNYDDDDENEDWNSYDEDEDESEEDYDKGGRKYPYPF